MAAHAESVSQTRRLVLVLQALVRSSGPYDTYADLVADLKVRLTKLRLSYDADAIGSAIAQLEAQGLLLRQEPAPGSSSSTNETPLSQADAIALLGQLTGGRVPLKRMLPGKRVVPMLDARAKALAILFEGIAEQQARCEALEAIMPAKDRE